MLSSNRSFDVVVLQRTAKKCTKMHDARADLLIKPIVYDVLVTSLTAAAFCLIFKISCSIWNPGISQI